MTSKDRVRAAIRHEQPDRVPLEFSGRAEVVAKLAAALGLRQGEGLEDRLGLDLRGVSPGFKGESAALCYADPTVAVTPEGVHRDIWGVGFVPNQTSCGFYMDLASNPLKDLASIEGLDEHPWPTADVWDYSNIADQAAAQRDYWIGAHSRGIFEISWFLRGFQEFMLDLACNPEFAAAIMDRVQAYLMERTRRILEAGRGQIDMVEYNDDMGGQEGMMIAPDMWRRFLKPRMADFIHLCKGHGAAVRYHSCGSVRAIIPDLVEIGVDVLNPVQSLAAGMDPFALKKEFGAHITFNGGIDTQQLLPYGTVDEVRAKTQRLIDVVGKDGGLILAPSHVFQDDVPIENIIAVYETAVSVGLGERGQ